MPRKQAKLRCSKCGQSFKLAMHLGRHMKAKHGKAAKAAKAKKAKKGGARKARRMGRPSGVAGRLGLRSMSLEQLMEVIAAAKREAGRRIAEFRKVMR